MTEEVMSDGAHGEMTEEELEAWGDTYVDEMFDDWVAQREAHPELTDQQWEWLEKFFAE